MQGRQLPNSFFDENQQRYGVEIKSNRSLAPSSSSASSLQPFRFDASEYVFVILQRRQCDRANWQYAMAERRHPASRDPRVQNGRIFSSTATEGWELHDKTQAAARCQRRRR
eukprot:m.853936 g.853936  ORF g.853936 m.853936 type:complete len:112 (-) comp23502_c1_seq49:775-1110(-)